MKISRSSRLSSISAFQAPNSTSGNCAFDGIRSAFPAPVIQMAMK
jgi:hypothetical protein